VPGRDSAILEDQDRGNRRDAVGAGELHHGLRFSTATPQALSGRRS
jgi:hypothetical protein